MQITVREAEDIVTYLQSENRVNQRTIGDLKKCVTEFRLDTELPQQGGRRNLRRTYTCPFFTKGPRGCSIAPEFKPLGCLAFNPLTAGRTQLSSQCTSDQSLLAKQESIDGNLGVRLPIPLAVLQVLDNMFPNLEVPS